MFSILEPIYGARKAPVRRLSSSLPFPVRTDSALRTRIIVADRSTDSTAIAESLRTPASFGVLFDRHFERIHGYLQRQVGGDLADDLAAQTFLVAFDRRASFDLSRESARPWLFGIAVNLMRRHLRDVRRGLSAYARTGVDPVLDGFDGAEARADAAALRRPLAKALATLPKPELETLLLHAWAELSYAEIAETLAIPVGTVRSRISRARVRLREPLADEGVTTHEGAADVDAPPDPNRGKERWATSS
jgi:RNA polymerase sigma-70 factor (ECF subfamily)